MIDEGFKLPTIGYKQITKQSNNQKMCTNYYFLIFLYSCALAWLYSHVVHPKYEYMGFESNVTIYWFLLGWIVLGVLAYLCKGFYFNINENVSCEIIFLLFLTCGIPFSVMVGHGCFSIWFVACNLFYWTILIMAYKVLTKHLKVSVPTISIGVHQLGKLELNIIIIGALIVIVYISGKYAHFRLITNLFSVYEYREEAASYTLPKIIVYIFSWTRAINTLLIPVLFKRKKYIGVTACFLAQILSFSIDGSKAVLFYTLCALGICFIPKMNIRKINSNIIELLFLALLFMTVVYLLFNNYTLISLFVRRVMFLPVKLESCYFDYFSNHQPDYYRGSFLRFFGFKSLYSQLPTIIGKEYFNAPNMGANNGLISDAMANLGYLGICVQPIFYAVILRILDEVSNRCSVLVCLVIALYICMLWVNTFLFTSLLTHGIIIIILLLVIINDRVDREFIQ